MVVWALAWFLSSLALGLLVRRWLILGLPAIVASVFYAGLAYGWWLNGLGDAWQVPFGIAIVSGTIGVTIGVFVRNSFDFIPPRISANQRKRIRGHRV